MYPKACPDGFLVLQRGVPTCLDPSQTAPTVCRPDTKDVGDNWCEFSNGGKTGKTDCPPGYSKDSLGRADTCMKHSGDSCPSGSTIALVRSASSMEGFCLPNNVVTYPIDPNAAPGSGIPPCKTGDFTILGTDPKCLPATPGVAPAPDPSAAPSTTGGSAVDTPPPAAPPPPSSPAAPQTSQSYEEDLAAYENAITQALASNDASKLPDIRARADRAIAALNKRIEDMTYLK